MPACKPECKAAVSKCGPIGWQVTIPLWSPTLAATAIGCPQAVPAAALRGKYRPAGSRQLLHISPFALLGPLWAELYMQTHPPTKTLGSTGALLDGLLGGRSSLFRTKMFWRISFEVFFLLNKIFSVSSAFLWQLATRGIHKVSLFENSLLLVLSWWRYLPDISCPRLDSDAQSLAHSLSPHHEVKS